MLAGANPSQTKFQAIGPKVIDCEVIINNDAIENKKPKLILTDEEKRKPLKLQKHSKTLKGPETA